jgi:hypothetical protein
VAANDDFNATQLNQIKRLVDLHADDLLEAWHEYFTT